MSAVVQSNSGFTSSSPFNVAFNNPVTKGNLIIALVYGVPFDTAPTDTQGNSYATAITAIGPSYGIFYATAGATGSLTLTNPAVGEVVHMHIYEISGYAALDQTGSVSNSPGGTLASVSTSGPTTTAKEVVVALFTSSDTSFAQSWTPQAGVDASQSSGPDSGNLVPFSEVFEVNSTGVQTATATLAHLVLGVNAVIATFALAPTPPPAFGGAPAWVYANPAALPRGGNQARRFPPAVSGRPGVIPPWLGGPRKG